MLTCGLVASVANKANASRVVPVSIHLHGIYVAPTNTILSAAAEPALHEAISQACGNDSNVATLTVSTSLVRWVNGSDTANLDITGSVTCQN